MSQPNVQAVDVHSLHQQIRTIMTGIQHLAQEVGGRDPPPAEADVIDGVNKLGSDLDRIKAALEHLKSMNKPKAVGSETNLVPSILGGMALGVALGKLMGSKLQLDLLPFLIGLDLVVEDSNNSQYRSEKH